MSEQALQVLVEDSAEALIRMYGEIMRGKKANPLFIDAHLANMQEAFELTGIDTIGFHVDLIQTLCCTIVKLVEELDA
jgi:hypothetical protein